MAVRQKGDEGDEIDFVGREQPKLSPAMLAKIADTVSRKTGRVYTTADAEAWWDWSWPNFEQYWAIKRYRNISRAITGWANRIRVEDMDAALDAVSARDNAALEQEQSRLNAEAVADAPTPINYFAKMREAQSK